MDPNTPTTSTTVQPPSSPPHTPIHAIIETPTDPNHQRKNNISRNMKHFKSLMLKLSRQLLPAQQQPLIEQRFNDVFNDHEFLVPDHPQYNDMILTALWELNSEGGNSSVEAISNFIKKEYRELPYAHSIILNRHLKDLCSKGKIYMTQDKCYHRTKPLPISSPCDHLPSDDISYLSSTSSPSSSTSDGTCSSPSSSTSDGTCSSPSSSTSDGTCSSPSSSNSDGTFSNPSSSTSDSTCSSPSSSSARLCWGPEGRGRERIQVRDSCRGRGRGRGRGSGRPRKMLQVGQRASSCGKIQAGRRWSRPIKTEKIGERSQIDEDLVDVRVVKAKTIRLEEHAQVGQRGSSCGKIQAARRWGRPCKTDKIGERSPIDEDLVDVRVVKAKTIRLEEHAQVAEDQEVTGMEIEQGVIQDGAEKQQIKSENNNNAVVGTWLSVEDLTDVSEEESLSCEQLIVGKKYRPQKDYNVRWIGRPEHILGRGECVKQRGSGSRQHSRNVQRQSCEQIVERTKEQDQQRKQCNVIWIGRGVRKLKEAARDPSEEQSDDDVTEPENDLNDAEIDELVKQSQQKIETEETTAEHNRTEENQQSDILEKPDFGEERVTTVPYEGHDQVGMEPVLEVQMADEQDLVMMQCEAEITIANVGKQLDDTVEGQNSPEEQLKKGNEQEFQPHKQHTGGDAEQKILEKQVEMETAEDTEAEEQVETKGQSSELRDNVTENSLQSSREDQVKHGEAELAEERPQQEEQRATLTQKILDSEVQQDQYSYMIEEKNQPYSEKDGLQSENHVVGNENMGSCSSTIGRGVWRLKGVARVPFEGQPDDSVTRMEDDFCDAQADEHVEQTKQGIEIEETIAEQKRTEEKQQSDIAEKQILQDERVTSVIDDNNFPCEGHHQVGMQPIHEVQMADEQDSVMMQCKAEVAVTSLGKQVDDTVEEQILPEEQPKKGNGEDSQTDELQKCGDSEKKILEKQSAENTEAEEQNNYLTEEQLDRIEHSSEQLQQEEQQTKVNEKEVMPVVDSESQQEQGVEMIDDQNPACTEKDVLQDDRVGTEPVIEVQMADEQESMMMKYEAQGAVISVETAETTEAEEQNNCLTKEQVETKGQSSELHDDITEELIYPQEQCVGMAAVSLQSCEEDEPKKGEAEFAEEQPQEEEQKTDVTQKEMDSEVQEQYFDTVEEKNQPCIVKDVLQEDKDAASSEYIASSGSTIDGSRDFSCNSSDHKFQDEARRPLRQGLRSSCKKEETTPITKNQLEDVTPVRRVLRSSNTVSGAAGITEVPDDLKEQPEHSERTRSSKRKLKIPEAEPVANLRKTRRTGL